MLKVGPDVVRNVFGQRIHHDLHHGDAGYGQLPDDLAPFLLAALDGRCIACRHGAVAGHLDRMHPLGRPHHVGLPHHAGPVAAGAHLGIAHSGNALEGVLDGEGTGSAVHALDGNVRLPDAFLQGMAMAEPLPFIGVIQQLDGAGGRKRGGCGHEKGTWNCDVPCNRQPGRDSCMCAGL